VQRNQWENQKDIELFRLDSDHQIDTNKPHANSALKYIFWAFCTEILAHINTQKNDIALIWLHGTFPTKEHFQQA